MKTRILSAGDGIEARCTRCRAVLNHTIVATVGERVIRVECNTCHGIHNYHAEKLVKEPAAAGTARKKAASHRQDPGAADRAEWASLQATVEPERAIPYDMNATFRVKNLVMHPVFGLGIVQLVLTPNKIEVLFQDGKKLLRCG